MLLRRFFVLQSLLLWQGGFFFYALVVVPIGTEFLGSATQQGFVTQRVTLWINRIGWAALAIAMIDSLTVVPRMRLRVALLGLSFLFQAALVFWLHDALSGRLDFDELRIRERGGFYDLHRWYLILSGLQWLVMLAFLFVTLLAWRAVDSHPGVALRKIFKR